MDERSGDSSGTPSIRGAAAACWCFTWRIDISAVLQNERYSSVTIQADLVQRTSSLTFIRRIEVWNCPEDSFPLRAPGVNSAQLKIIEDEYCCWSTYPYSPLSFDVFFPGGTRPGSAARAGTLTYIHTYVSKPMSTTVDRAITSFVRRRLGLATGRPDLISSKLRSLGQHCRLWLLYIPRSCFYTLTLRRAYLRTCCAPLRSGLGSFPQIG